MNDRRTSVDAHMAAYTFLHLMLRLGVRSCQVYMLRPVECTRCGGNHPLSECKWPLIRM